MKITHDHVWRLFSHLENNRSAQFFEHVSDNVVWQVMGTHPLAGHYHNKAAFLEATFKRLDKILKEGVILKVNHVFVDGSTAIVEMQSLSTAVNEKPFNNTYCWITHFNETGKITAVRAYVDSALVQTVIQENEPALTQ